MMVRIIVLIFLFIPQFISGQNKQSLSNQKMDKDALQLELLKARKHFQRDLDVTKSSIDKRLGSMLKKIKDLEKLSQAPLAAPRSSGGATAPGRF